MMDEVFLRYHDYLGVRLSLARLRHSEGAAQVMEQLAPVYGLDRQQAIAAGLLHDAAKALLGEEHDRWLLEAGLDGPTAVGEDDYNLYLHGPAGAARIRVELGLEDPLVLDAIATHTFWGGGEGYHRPLSWCLRFADLIEPNRGWNNRPWLRDRLGRIEKLIYTGDLEKAALLQTGWVVRLFEELGAPVHPNMHCILAELRRKVPVDDDFWDQE